MLYITVKWINCIILTMEYQTEIAGKNLNEQGILLQAIT